MRRGERGSKIKLSGSEECKKEDVKWLVSNNFLVPACELDHGLNSGANLNLMLVFGTHNKHQDVHQA